MTCYVKSSEAIVMKSQELVKGVETVWTAISAHGLGIILKNKGVGEKQCLPTDPTFSEMEPKLVVTQWEH